MKNLYLIKLLTNMHVGSGDIGFSLVDNQVQRDPITNYPTINSSSLKGALREHFEGLAKEDNLINNIFGDKNDKTPGFFKFFAANLLSYPVRSNKKAFFRATCPQIIEEFLRFLNDFGLEYDLKDDLENLRDLGQENTPIIFEKKLNDVIIEDYVVKDIETHEKIKTLETLFGENIVLFSNEQFKSIIEDLPVIPRNKLENGESKNLWYEEIVPRETRFYFWTMNSGEEKLDEKFKEILTAGPIQIGGNATIGYGFTKIDKIEKIGGGSRDLQ